VVAGGGAATRADGRLRGVVANRCYRGRAASRCGTAMGEETIFYWLIRAASRCGLGFHRTSRFRGSNPLQSYHVAIIYGDRYGRAI
jgi:hypothetical protein